MNALYLLKRAMAAAEPQGDAYATYLALVRQLPHSNPGKTTDDGVNIRSYHAEGEHELHSSYISIRVRGVLFSIGVNPRTPPAMVTLNSVTAGVTVNLRAQDRSPAELLRRLVRICVAATRRIVLGAAEPHAQDHADGLSLWTTLWDSLGDGVHVITVSGMSVRLRVSSHSSDMLVLETDVGRTQYRGFVEYNIAKAGVRDILDIDVANPKHPKMSRQVRFKITPLMTPKTLLQTVLKQFHSIVTSFGTATAAAEPQPELTWRSFILALPDEAQHKWSQSRSATKPTVYRYNRHGYDVAVVVTKNGYALLTDSAGGVRVEFRSGRYEGGVGPAVQLGRPVYLKPENYRSAQDFLREITTEFRKRTRTLK